VELHRLYFRPLSLFIQVPSSVFMKMAEVANLITVIIIGERKKLLLKARLPFHFFPGQKSESSIMEQFV